jgi:hypothetical protein
MEGIYGTAGEVQVNRKDMVLEPGGKEMLTYSGR